VKYLIKTLLIILITLGQVYATEYLYILDDKCINSLYSLASMHFENSEISPLKDSRGLVLRYYFEDFLFEFENPNIIIYKKIEDFLAKIENPAIIEVHTSNFSDNNLKNFKQWEISTIMANNIEAIITTPTGSINQNRINSIGYGEFLPAKNTPNNGGKKLNRIDIIILCNIIGE